jgi:hypothetical protein
VTGATGPAIERAAQITLAAPTEAITTANIGQLLITDDLNGLNLVDAVAAVVGAATTGAIEVAVFNYTQAAVEMLTTRITIDATETSSYTAATQPVIDTANDDVATGDIILVQVTDDADGLATGIVVTLTFG